MSNDGAGTEDRIIGVTDRAQYIQKQRMVNQFCNQGTHEDAALQNEPSPERTGDMNQLPLRVSLNSALTKESNRKMENPDSGKAISPKSSVLSNSNQDSRKNSFTKQYQNSVFKQQPALKSNAS